MKIIITESQYKILLERRLNKLPEETVNKIFHNEVQPNIKQRISNVFNDIELPNVVQRALGLGKLQSSIEEKINDTSFNILKRKYGHLNYIVNIQDTYDEILKLIYCKFIKVTSRTKTIGLVKSVFGYDGETDEKTIKKYKKMIDGIISDVTKEFNQVLNISMRGYHAFNKYGVSYSIIELPKDRVYKPSDGKLNFNKMVKYSELIEKRLRELL